jgi:hypothetical protein
MEEALRKSASFGRLVSEPHSFIETNKQHEEGRLQMVFPYKIRLRADWIAVILVVGKTAGNE